MYVPVKFVALPHFAPLCRQALVLMLNKLISEYEGRYSELKLEVDAGAQSGNQPRFST